MAVNKTINKRTNTHGAMRNCIEYVLRQDKTDSRYFEIFPTGKFPGLIVDPLRNAFDFPHSVFARRTLLFAACFAQREFLHQPLLTGVFLQLRLISLLPIQNSLIEKSAFLPGKPSADFCPFGDNRDLDMCFGIRFLQQHQMLKHRKAGHFGMAPDVL